MIFQEKIFLFKTKKTLFFTFCRKAHTFDTENIIKKILPQGQECHKWVFSKNHQIGDLHSLTSPQQFRINTFSSLF
jgi:hypothetical protein